MKLFTALLAFGAAATLPAGTATARPAEFVPNHTFSQLEKDPPWGLYATTRIAAWPDAGDPAQVWHEDMCQHPKGYRCADLEGHKQISHRFTTVPDETYTVCVDVNANPTEPGRQRLKIDADPSRYKAETVDTGADSIRTGSAWEAECHRFRTESTQTRIIFTGMPGPEGAAAGATFTNVTLR
ncbi:hypothetical protein ACPZ19_21400 [Amycolatopsis lurida]